MPISPASRLLKPQHGIKIEALESSKTSAIMADFDRRQETEAFDGKKTKELKPVYLGGFPTGGVQVHGFKASSTKISQQIFIRG